MLACPTCGATALKAYFARRLTCGNCHADLISNVGTVTMWEGIISLFLLWIPRSLLAQVFGSAWYVDWAIFFPLVVIVHFALLSALVEFVPARSDR